MGLHITCTKKSGGDTLNVTTHYSEEWVPDSEAFWAFRGWSPYASSIIVLLFNEGGDKPINLAL
jgi:hypothetical protein